MAIDPESIGLFFGAVLASVGASWGGSKVLEKRKQANQEPTSFCLEHHKCFDEIKKGMKDQEDAIHSVKEDVAWICGAMGKPKD